MNPTEVLKQKCAAYVRTLKNIEARAARENRDLTEPENNDATGLLEKIEAIDQTLKAAGRIDAIKSGPVDLDGAYLIRRSNDLAGNDTKGLSFARYLIGRTMFGNDTARIETFVTRTWGNDAAVVKALGGSILSEGGAFAPQELASDFIAYLRGRSAVRAAGPVSITLPETGSVPIPRITNGATASWTGENENISLSEPSTGQLRMTAKKLAVIAAISNDLVRTNGASADTIVRDDLARAVAAGEDQAYLRSIGTENSPTGLRYLAAAANLINVNATVNATNIKRDLSRAQLALTSANVPMTKPVWIMSERTKLYLMDLVSTSDNPIFPEMTGGSLRGIPYLTTTHVPNNLSVTDSSESEIYLADFSQVVLGETGNLIVQTSDVAAYHDGSNVVAAFSKDQTVIKLVLKVDIALRYSEACAVLIDVDWGA